VLDEPVGNVSVGVYVYVKAKTVDLLGVALVVGEIVSELLLGEVFRG
jgi:hypothetical protein